MKKKYTEKELMDWMVKHDDDFVPMPPKAEYKVKIRLIKD